MSVGVFLRSFTWGHVRRLDKAAGAVLARAQAAGAGPGEESMTIDLDSTVCEVAGKKKAGAAYGHTEQLGYHPLVGVRADTGEILHSRLRGGSSQSAQEHFAAETVAPPRRAGAAGQLTVRADSGFFSYDLLGRLDALKVRRSITVSLYSHVEPPFPLFPTTTGRPSPTPTAAKRTSPRPPTSPAVAATNAPCASSCGAPASPTLNRPSCGPDRRHHAFVTNRDDLDTVAADIYHRQHATVELATGDLKNSTGLAHLPSGNFAANAAWLTRRRARPQPLPRDRPTPKNTTRQQTHRRANRPQPPPALPGRLVNHAGRTILRLPARWPPAATFHTTLTNIANLPQLC